MEWIKLVAGPLTGAAVAGIVALLVALVGPGRYRGWRLKKLLDIVNGLDEEQFPGQREPMLAEVERLSTRIAVGYKVPEDWPLLFFGFMFYGASMGSTIAAVWVWESPTTTLVKTAAVVGAVALFVLNWRVTQWCRSATTFTAHHRLQFVLSGLGEAYEVPSRPRPRWFKKRVYPNETMPPPRRPRPNRPIKAVPYPRFDRKPKVAGSSRRTAMRDIR